MTEIVTLENPEPPFSEKLIKWSAAIVAAAILVGTFVWSFGLVPGLNAPHRENAIMTIAPYRHNGTWVFDDLSAGLVQEPFIAGVPEMIDILVEDIPNADNGFRLVFSANAFPDHQQKLEWKREESGGNYYSIDEPPMEGWICPAMFKYFAKGPKNLFVKAEPLP